MSGSLNGFCRPDLSGVFGPSTENLFVDNGVRNIFLSGKNNGVLTLNVIQREIPSTIVFENENLVGFNDINPVAPQHVLFVPKKHLEKIHDMSKDDSPLIGELIYHAKEYARKINLTENGYRLVFNTGRDAGQDVFHIHLHLIGGRIMTWPPG